MRNKAALKFILLLTAVIILIPGGVIALWTVTGRWPWPSLLPESYTGRTVAELFTGSSKIYDVLASSIVLAALVAVIGTTIALMTARATEVYRIKGRQFISFAALLPLMVPGTVFAMGIQVYLIRMGLGDTLTGVVIVHLVAALPYCITIMMDMTAAVGDNLEEQAQVLGAGPVRAFRDVGIPELMPGIISSISMAFIISYSQYFTTLLAGGGKIKTLALVMVPYIQSGDRALSSIYAFVFISSALIVFAVFETILHRIIRDSK